MNVITPGYKYEIETTDLTTYPTGLMTIQFNKPTGATPALGVISSQEIIDMMLDRYFYLASTAEDESEACLLDYRLAYKAEKMVKDYVSTNEP